MWLSIKQERLNEYFQVKLENGDVKSKTVLLPNQPELGSTAHKVFTV